MKSSLKKGKDRMSKSPAASLKCFRFQIVTTKGPLPRKHSLHETAWGSSVPVRIECAGGAAVWITGTLAFPSMQGNLVTTGTGGMTLLGFFSSLWYLCPSGDQAWRWHSYLDCRDSGGARCARKPKYFSREY